MIRFIRKKKVKLRNILCFIIFILIITLGIVPKNVSAASKSSANNITNEIIEIPLSWSRNYMNKVNSEIPNRVYKKNFFRSYYEISPNDYNREGISSEYSKNIFNHYGNTYVLNSPSEAEIYRCYESESNKYYYYKTEGIYSYYNLLYKWIPFSPLEYAIPGKTLRTDFIMRDNTKNYTIDYRILEKWFLRSGINSNGIKPLPVRFTWNDDDPQDWQQSTNQNYNTQDWNLFRGIADFSNIKDPNTNKLINPEDYRFYLAAPSNNGANMFIGANDLISVFVDKMATEINYTTSDERSINFIQGDGTSKLITYGSEHQWKIGSQCPPNSIIKESIDGWHVDLNTKSDKDGNAVLGDVTDIIREARYGNRHAIDLLTSEWCNEGGVTKIGLYAVKVPKIKVEKQAYIKTKDLNGKSLLEKDILSKNNKGDIILNTTNNVPNIPAEIPIYFRFILSNIGNTEVDNLDFYDSNLNVNYNLSSKGTASITNNNGENLSGNISILDEHGSKILSGNLLPGKTITLEDEKNLVHKVNSTSYGELNKEFTNTVIAKAKYFFDQLDVSANSTVNLKTYVNPKIQITKKIVSINEKNIDFDKSSNILSAGDKVKFLISVKNNSSVAIGGLSLKDTLKCTNENDLTNWNFITNNKNINPKNFILNPEEEIDFYTTWQVTNLSDSTGNNIAYIDIDGYNDEFSSNKVEFNIKAKKGTINVTKNVSNYSNLSFSDKKVIDNQLFTINLIDNTNGTIQTVSIKDGQTAQFTGLNYGDNYTIKESTPMNYKIESILNNITNSNTFNMTDDTDNSKVVVTNIYLSDNSINWYESIANKLNTASSF